MFSCRRLKFTLRLSTHLWNNLSNGRQLPQQRISKVIFFACTLFEHCWLLNTSTKQVKQTKKFWIIMRSM